MSEYWNILEARLMSPEGTHSWPSTQNVLHSEGPPRVSQDCCENTLGAEVVQDADGGDLGSGGAVWLFCMEVSSSQGRAVLSS